MYTIVNKKYAHGGVHGMTICEESRMQISNVPQCYVIRMFHFFVHYFTDNIDVETVSMSEALAILIFIRYKTTCWFRQVCIRLSVCL